MTSKAPLKSILKKPSSATPPLSASKAERDRQTALYHANLIQQQKDIELEILTSTETLLDLPTAADADPAEPSSADRSLFRRLVIPFQPSDYDSLVQERNIIGKCGYVLCPRPPQKQDTKAKYSILYGRGREGFKVVERESLERWCSPDCARRGLYIRVQLNEEPAWIRQGEGSEVTLWGESHVASNETGDKEASDKGVTKEAGRTEAELSDEELAWKLRDLALERGESARTPATQQSVEVRIQENPQAWRGPVTAPSLPADGPAKGRTNHLSIEGHRPGGPLGRERAKDQISRAEEDDERDTDWKL